MIREVDRSSPIPIYKQIANFIEIDIKNKKYDENFKLPTENEFTKIYNVSRMTIRQALKLLEDKGLISRKAGKGTFLNDNRLNNPMEGSHSFSKLIETQGLKAGAKLISASLEKPTAEDLKELNLKENSHIIVIKRTRYVNKEPVSYEISRFTEDYKFLLTKNLNDTSLYDILYKEKNIYFTKTKRTIELVQANDILSNYLQVEKNYPIILIKGIAIDNYNNISHRAFEYILGDKFKFTI